MDCLAIGALAVLLVRLRCIVKNFRLCRRARGAAPAAHALDPRAAAGLLAHEFLSSMFTSS